MLTHGWISDNNLWRIFSEVKYWPKYYPFKQLGTLFCALVDCNHHTMTATFEYRGSLAWYFVHILSLVTSLQQPFMNQQKEENDHRNYFMINLHKSMGPGRDRTLGPWICSQLYARKFFIFFVICWFFLNSSYPRNTITVSNSGSTPVQPKCFCQPWSGYKLWGGGQGGTPFPVPSPFPPTSLPLLPHFPPPSPPLTPPSPPLPSPYQIFPPPDKILFLFKN